MQVRSIGARGNAVARHCEQAGETIRINYDCRHCPLARGVRQDRIEPA